MLQPTVAKISLKNLQHNANLLRKMAGETTFFCAMVKADAYGHGAVPVAQALLGEGVQCLGVSRVEEAQELRAAGCSSCEILLFDPLIDSASAEIMFFENITPVVSNWESLRVLQAAARGRKISIHIKFNSGMSRLGFSKDDAAAISDHLKSNSVIKLTGVCSHLLSGEDYGIENSRTQVQLNNFNSISKHFSGINLKMHILNSCALLAFAAHGEKNTLWGVRPGLSLYGIKPEILTQKQSVQDAWGAMDLKPVMQVETVVSHIQKIAKGDSVSYGGRFVASRNTTLAVLPIGYADGYARHFSNQGTMLFRGKKVNVTGTVCMDFTIVDVTDVEQSGACQLGEKIVVLGEQQGEYLFATQLAKMINTNPYEILTNMSARVPRIYS